MNVHQQIVCCVHGLLLGIGLQQQRFLLGSAKTQPHFALTFIHQERQQRFFRSVVEVVLTVTWHYFVAMEQICKGKYQSRIETNALLKWDLQSCTMVSVWLGWQFLLWLQIFFRFLFTLKRWIWNKVNWPTWNCLCNNVSVVLLWKDGRIVDPTHSRSIFRSHNSTGKTSCCGHGWVQQTNKNLFEWSGHVLFWWWDEQHRCTIIQALQGL